MKNQGNSAFLYQGFNMKTGEPIDARFIANSFSDLIIRTEEWNENTLYNGLLVSVLNGNEDKPKGVYMLINNNEYTNSDNWELVGSEGGGGSISNNSINIS